MLNSIDIKSYAKFIVLYILIDLIWLLGAKKLHNKQVKDIQKEDLKLNPVGAVGFYTFAPLGYFIFVKQLAKNKKDAFKYGCIFGFLMYMTFDFTNLAIFKKYSIKYAMMDIAWGTLAYGILSTIFYTREV